MHCGEWRAGRACAAPAGLCWKDRFLLFARRNRSKPHGDTRGAVGPDRHPRATFLPGLLTGFASSATGRKTSSCRSILSCWPRPLVRWPTSTPTRPASNPAAGRDGGQAAVQRRRRWDHAHRRHRGLRWASPSDQRAQAVEDDQEAFATGPCAEAFTTGRPAAMYDAYAGGMTVRSAPCRPTPGWRRGCSARRPRPKSAAGWPTSSRLPWTPGCTLGRLGRAGGGQRLNDQESSTQLGWAASRRVMSTALWPGADHAQPGATPSPHRGIGMVAAVFQAAEVC
jgi:hypothetical protein